MYDSFATLWTIACHAPLSVRFPKQEHWSRLPFSSPQDLLDPGIELMSPALVGRFFTVETSGKPQERKVVKEGYGKGVNNPSLKKAPLTKEMKEQGYTSQQVITEANVTILNQEQRKRKGAKLPECIL